MAFPLSSTEYPAVRAVLDVDLNTQNLPDTTIALDIYEGAANQDVLDRDPAAASRTGTDGERVLRAAIYFCAARLTGAVVRLTSISIQARDLTYAKQTFDPTERAEELRDLANDELDEVLGEETDNSGLEAGVMQYDYQQTDRVTDLP